MRRISKKYNKQPKIAAVVVSYNRQDLVLQTLSAINSGKIKPDILIIVDNNSSDNSVENIKNFIHNDLDSSILCDFIELEKNTGGTGGFTIGIDKAAFEFDADVIWIMDDDTEPTEDALRHLISVWENYAPNFEFRPAFVASKVVWSDGRDHPMNTPRVKPRVSASELKRARKANTIPVRSASFVSLLLDGDHVREKGLPIADYFLWNDDFEYTARLARHSFGLYAPRSVVKHHTKKFGSTDQDPGERFTYEVRNKLWMFTRTDSLAPTEKIMYGGATFLRWMKTFAKSEDKKTLATAFKKGIRQAGSTKPHDNNTLLEPVYSLSSSGQNNSSQKGIATQKPSKKYDKFSVLLPYYRKTKIEHLKKALDSVTMRQTVKPDEIVLVQDGKVDKNLETFVKKYKKASDIDFKLVKLNKNQGLAKALDRGIKHTRHEIVARMDADDISEADRFEAELELVNQGFDLVGTDIAEFITDDYGVDKVVAIRNMPQTHEEIVQVSHFKSPFNHPSVMYKKSFVEKAGGYKNLDSMEDYWLFSRMIAIGVKTANVPQALMKYRSDEGSYTRRGGARMLFSELNLQSRLLYEGYNNPLQFVRNVAVRGGYRLVPENLRHKLYHKRFTTSVEEQDKTVSSF